MKAAGLTQSWNSDSFDHGKECSMYTVIVAEDEERIRRGIVKNVKWESAGFRVIGEAENGADALEMVEQLEPDLLITDIRMPFINGIELARQIREVRPAVRSCS